MDSVCPDWRNLLEENIKNNVNCNKERQKINIK